MHLAVPCEPFRQHHDTVLFSIMFADQHGAGLEPEWIIKLQVGSLVPGSEFPGDPLKETLKWL